MFRVCQSRGKTPFKQRIRTHNKTYDDIILAYGSTESVSTGLPNLGYPDDDIEDRVARMQQQRYPYTGMGIDLDDESSQIQQWNELVPIDEGPELIYASQKAMESHLTELRAKKPKFNLKSKSMDNICNTIKSAAQGIKIKKKKPPPPPPGSSSVVNTSMESLGTDENSEEDRQDQISRVLYGAIEDMYTLPDPLVLGNPQRLSQSTPAFYENVPIQVSTISRAQGREVRARMYEHDYNKDTNYAVKYEDNGTESVYEDINTTEQYKGVVFDHSTDVIAL